jgi:phosphoglycerate kinase
VEEDRVLVAREVLDVGGDRIVLPVDCVVAPELVAGAHTRTVGRDAVTTGDRIGDVGPKTRALFREEIGRARTLVWNGPMGMFEVPGFADGTTDVARAVAEACDKGALGVIGGGDSAAAAAAAGVSERLTHVSTGGGASLELLAGEALPGVECLSDWEG